MGPSIDRDLKYGVKVFTLAATFFYMTSKVLCLKWKSENYNIKLTTWGWDPIIVKYLKLWAFFA